MAIWMFGQLVTPVSQIVAWTQIVVCRTSCPDIV
jgi:hypothetical protein